MSLEGRKVALGVGGGIAAYKAVLLARELIQRGAEVRVSLSPGATHFVGALTFSGVTGRPALTDLFDPSVPGEVHVALGAWADAVVVAPATMNLLARAAQGQADDVVLATVACARSPVLYAPAMHTRMWERATTARNVARLRDDGAHFVGPVPGPLASGEEGMGRMSEPEAIADALESILARGRDLSGLRLLVTAGPTHEDLDPVRFLGNRSSGRMGLALAARAAARGAEVTLVHGPIALGSPPGVTAVAVRSALEMHDAVLSRQEGMDAIVMAAAVADYRPASRSEHKRKKTDGPLWLELVRNPDILAELGAARQGARPMLVGFAVETEDLVARARQKRIRKGVDLIVANPAEVGFGGGNNEATLVERAGETALSPMPKERLADLILDRIGAHLDPKGDRGDLAP